MPVSVAIVGAGPSGFYAADAIFASGLDCCIDLIEALPTPFGLVRSGVAPDHQHTKRVIRGYEKTLLDERVSYFGNVEVSRHVSFDELREIYDAVVVAVGAPEDRRLRIPGHDKEGIYGSAAFVGWYNGHPDHRDLAPDLETEGVVVIGNGNVALDIARVLIKTPEEMAGSDLPDYAARAIHSAPIREVKIVGRRGPLEAKFSNVELRELGTLADCDVVVDEAALPDAVPEAETGHVRRVKERNLKTFREFAGRPRGRARKRLEFLFNARPVEFLGDHRVREVRFQRTVLEGGHPRDTGDVFEIPCGMVVTAIGTLSRPLEGLPFDPAAGVVPNEGGRVSKGLYVVGWAKRGATGVIGTNKPDAEEVAQHIRRDVPEGVKPGRPALERLLNARGIRWVSREEWQAIDAAEVAAARKRAPRKKLARIRDMLSVLDRSRLRRKSASKRTFNA